MSVLSMLAEPNIESGANIEVSARIEMVTRGKVAARAEIEVVRRGSEQIAVRGDYCGSSGKRNSLERAELRSESLGSDPGSKRYARVKSGRRATPRALLRQLSHMLLLNPAKLAIQC